VLAHDYLTLGLLSPDGLGFKMHASSLGVVSGTPEYRVTSARDADGWQWDFYIARDYTVLPDDSVRAHVWVPQARQTVAREFRPDPFFLRAYSERGIRSELRVPIQLQGERVGFLFFCSRRPNVYGEEDVELARRIADHVALAIAHERLAEEGKRASQAQQRAGPTCRNAWTPWSRSSKASVPIGRLAGRGSGTTPSRRRRRWRRPTPPC